MSTTSDNEEIATFTIRIPKRLWRAATLDKMETKESLNALIVRLLESYYPNRK